MPEELFIANLRDEFPECALGYMTKDAARDSLMRMTGQDFGFDVAKWKAWFRSHPVKTGGKLTDPRAAIRIMREKARAAARSAKPNA
jgi:hypothetical protein